LVFSVEVPANADVSTAISVISSIDGLRVMRTMTSAAPAMPFTVDGQPVKGRSFMTNDVVTHVDGVHVAGDATVLRASSSVRVFTVHGVPTKHLKSMTYQERGVLGMETEYRQPGGGRQRFRNTLNMYDAVDGFLPSDLREKPQKGRRPQKGLSKSSSSGAKRKAGKKRSRSHADKETLATIAAAAGAAEDAAVDALHDDMPLGQFTQPVAKKDAPVRSSRTSKPPPRLLEEL
jgi:hypothetical protein